MELDETSIGRIAQATEEIWQSQDRIVTEFIAIGARLNHIDGIIMNALTRSLGNHKLARKRASSMLASYATQGLRMSESLANLYINVYRRFANHSRAVTHLTLGEMAILVRKDITDAEVDEVIDHKLTNDNFKREDIREFIVRLREAQEDKANVALQLKVAQEALNANLDSQRDLETQVRDLRVQLKASQNALDDRQQAINDAHLQVTRSTSAVSALQQAIDRLTRDRNALAAQVEASKSVIVKEAIEVVTLPAGYKTLDDALQAANARLEEANDQLRCKSEEIANLDQQIALQQTELDTTIRARSKLNALLAELEAVSQKYQSAQLAVLFSSGAGEFRDILQGVASVLTKFLGEVNAALTSGSDEAAIALQPRKIGAHGA
ncbi:hypothetical protein HFK91_14240 [Ralstonia pseudosolanacearum]|nr:hypothetical protein [Ralstonia pseudosolanacearum]